MDNKVKQETEEAMTETLEVEKEKTPLVIKVSPNNKIDRSLLNPPTKPGMAPTFKKDGTPVELHYIEQNPDAPFKEMHWEDHRGKGNFKGDHPNFNQPDRMDMNKYKNIKI